MEQFNKLHLPSFPYQKGVIHDEQCAYSFNQYPYKQFFMYYKKIKANSNIMPKVPINYNNNNNNNNNNNCKGKGPISYIGLQA